MCEDGLVRNEDQIKKGQMNALFPKLQDVNNSTVAKKLTAAIRISLDGFFPTKSGRSTRRNRCVRG